MRLDINQEKNVVLIDDFNFFTDTKLEAMGGSLALTKKLVAKLIEIVEGFEFCDIGRILAKSLVHKHIHLGFFTYTFWV